MEDKPLEILEESSTDQNKEVQETMRNNAKNKKIISEEQRAHLAYARSMKKAKQATRESEAQVQNNNLDFIYRRLTNIENQIRSIADTTPVPPPPNPAIKRPPLPEEVVLPPTPPKKAKIESPKKEDSQNSFTDTLKYYAVRGAIVFGTGLVLSLGKQYLSEPPSRKTHDGDHIGNYYVGPDA